MRHPLPMCAQLFHSSVGAAQTFAYYYLFIEICQNIYSTKPIQTLALCIQYFSSSSSMIKQCYHNVMQIRYASYESFRAYDPILFV